MAGVDKLYGTEKEWQELFDWLRFRSGRVQYVRYLYIPQWMDWEVNPPRRIFSGEISNFPARVDKWLYKNCPLKWVKERIREQYNGAPK